MNVEKALEEYYIKRTIYLGSKYTGEGYILAGFSDNDVVGLILKYKGKVYFLSHYPGLRIDDNAAKALYVRYKLERKR